MARPIEFTDDVVRKLEEVFALGGSVAEACFYADISRDTYYRHIKEKPELSDRFEQLGQRPILKARQTIVRALDNPHDAQWFLERKRKNEFAQRTEMTGKDGEALNKTIDVNEFDTILSQYAIRREQKDSGTQKDI